MNQHLRDSLAGAFWGSIIGTLVGLAIRDWIIDGPVLFVGELIAAGAMIGGILGFVYGDSFVEWIREHWLWWFW